MSLVTLPFYQKRHKHFDQSYRNIQTRYLLDEYAAKKRTSTRSSSQKTVAQKSSSQRASSQTAEGATTCRICAKRVSAALEEEEAQETKRRYRSLVAAYGEAKRERFLRELAQLEEDVHLARSHARDELDRYALQHMVDDRLAWDRPSYEERLSRAPEILVRLRSHTVWERMPVKLCFTVQGFPTPVVQWYKDGSLICQAGEPGKYRIESKYGVHTLEINRKRARGSLQITADLSCSFQTAEFPSSDPGRLSAVECAGSLLRWLSCHSSFGYKSDIYSYEYSLAAVTEFLKRRTGNLVPFHAGRT